MKQILLFPNITQTRSAGLVKTGIGSFDSNLNGSLFEINFLMNHQSHQL